MTVINTIRNSWKALAVCALVAAVIVALGFGLGLPQTASAALGDEIVCEVYDELNDNLPSFPDSECDDNESPVCDEGYHEEEGECVADDPTPPTCDEGEHLENDVCVPDQTTENPPAESSGSSGGGGGGSSKKKKNSGEVLGTSTEVCSTPLLTTFLGLGKQNDPVETVELQAFLENELGLTNLITGTFGTSTKAAVEQFQLKYADEVLSPWLPFGLASAQTPTGYVYKTTQRMINKIYCASLEIPMPMLP